MPPSAESGKQEGFEPVSPSPSALSPISTRRRADGLGAPRHNNAAQESRSRSDLTKFLGFRSPNAMAILPATAGGDRPVCHDGLGGLKGLASHRSTCGDRRGSSCFTGCTRTRTRILVNCSSLLLQRRSSRSITCCGRQISFIAGLLKLPRLWKWSGGDLACPLGDGGDRHRVRKEPPGPRQWSRAP